jgi:hypothetical protein
LAHHLSEVEPFLPVLILVLRLISSVGNYSFDQLIFYFCRFPITKTFLIGPFEFFEDFELLMRM